MSEQAPAQQRREIFLTVKPLRYADMVRHFLEQAGFHLTGAGQMGSTDTRDMWFEVLAGAQADEFGQYFEQPKP